MKNFEEQRNEYYLKLRKHTEYVKKMAEDEKNKDLVRMLLIPENENELKLGNAYVMFMEDTLQIAYNAAQGNINEIDVENCIVVEYLAAIVKLVYADTNEEELKKVNELYNENLAKILYETVVLAIANPEEYMKALCNKCNVDIEDELALMRFQILLEKVSSKIKAPIPDNVYSEQNIDAFVAFTNQYHEICVNGIKEYSNSEFNEILEILNDQNAFDNEPNKPFNK